MKYIGALLPGSRGERNRYTGARFPGEIERTRQDGRLPLDVVFQILSNQRRRWVIRYLQAEGSTTLGELAECLARLEMDEPDAPVTSTERKRAYVVLYQHHLPKLADADVIEYDADRKTIELGDNIEQVVPYLQAGRSPTAHTGWVSGAVRRTRRFLAGWR